MRTVVALSFLVCVLHLMCHLLMGQHVPLAQQEATIVRKWLCSLQEPTAALSSFFFFSWLPVASLSLFSFAFHTQAIKSVSQCCDPLQHSLFLFFFVVVFLFLSFSPSLPPCGFVPRVRRLRLGVEQREEENPGGVEGVTFAALWLTTCVSGPLYLHVSHGKEGGGRGWRERKDKHMVLVCWVKFRVGLFVSCDEQREIQLWLLSRQWLDFSLK